jgi:hypothetical protein
MKKPGVFQENVAAAGQTRLQFKEGLLAAVIQLTPRMLQPATATILLYRPCPAVFGGHAGKSV